MFRWIAGALLSLVLTGTFAWVAHIDSALAAVSERQARIRETVSAIRMGNEAQYREVLRRLDEIERKIERWPR